MNLIKPSEEYEEAYNDLINEYKSNNEPLIPFPLKFDTKNFRKLIEMFEGFPKGIGIPQGFVEHYTFWLINKQNNILGVSNLRMRLTDALKREGGNIGYGIRPKERGKGYGTILLSKTLKRAKDLGLNRVLLTCDKSNIGSVRVIKKNGGKFESEEFLKEKSAYFQRYWIDL